MRFRFRCEYLGSAFFGWQEQNEHGQTKFVSVQSALQKAFAIALRAPVNLVASGRTDTGVHARGQCVHFDWEGDSFDCEKTVRSINGLTQRLIRIRNLEPCASDFHARHDAVSRYYQYTMFTRPVALMRDYGWECGQLGLDLNKMEREAKSFLGEHDFIRFCIPRNDGKSTLCTLSEFSLDRLNAYTAVWHIRGNRFLHRQVRAMVGTLFDVGLGRYPEGTVASIFADTFKGERTWAPPQGLVLEDVLYGR
jgi:tRNA pseudouridine38-40 synthase